MRLDSIKRKLEAQLINYFLSEGYSDEEIETSNLYTIEIKSNAYDKYSDIYVYAEIEVDEFLTVADSWNSIVQFFDPAAYFDVFTNGIYSARIYWESVKSKQRETSKTILDKRNQIKFGESLTAILEDEYDENFYLDDIDFDRKLQKLTISVSSNTYESKCAIKLYEYDLNSYDDLVSIYKNSAIKSLKSHMVEI